MKVKLKSYITVNTLKYINELHLEITQKCNLNCRYCYIGETTVDSSFDKFLDLEIAKVALARVLSNTKSKFLLLTFHGGEPMLQNAEWFDRFCINAGEEAARKNVSITFSMQSNATLMTDEHLKVFKKHNIMVGVSIDGLKRSHNAVRGGFEKTLRNTLRLNENNLLGGIISVLTVENYQDLCKFMVFLTENSIHRVSFNDYNAVGCGKRELAVKPDDIVDAWISIFEYMRKNVNGVKDRLTLLRIDRFLNPPNSEYFKKNLNCHNPYCHAGIKMIHVSASGEIYPCGSSACMGNKRFYLGDINRDIDESYWRNVLKDLHAKDRMYYEECHICEASTICSFGCSSFEKYDNQGKIWLCEATKKFHRYLKNFDRDVLGSLIARSKNMQLKN